MTFYKWLMKKHLDKQAEFTDLAVDIKLDKTFPQEAENLNEILAHLFACNMSNDALEMCKKAYREYRAYKINRRIK